MPVDTAGWTEVFGGFTSKDREVHCSTSGQRCRRGEPIYRGAFIDLEGFYTICRDSALQLGKLAGLIESDVADKAVARQIELEDELAEAAERVKVLEAAVDAIRALDDLYDDDILPDPEPET